MLLHRRPKSRQHRAPGTGTTWKRFRIFDHPRSCVVGSSVYNFGRVCMSVCLSDDNFQKPWPKKFILAHAAYLLGLRGSSYMKVIGSKSRSQEPEKVENSYSHNVKLQSAVTLVLSNMQHEVFGYSGSNGVTTIFVTWPEVNTHRLTKCTHSQMVLP